MKSETDLITSVFLRYYSSFHTIRKEESLWDAKWRKFNVKAVAEVSLDYLRVNILGSGYVTIEQSPHYKFICSNFASKDYEEYIERNFRTVDAGVQISKFKYLAISMAKDHRNASALAQPSFFKPNKLKILDGVHRLAVLRNLGVTAIPIRFTLDFLWLYKKGSN